MSRRSAEQTRELLIETAIAMLHDLGPAAGVAHIRLSDVVDRAGLTTGAAYRLWDDQKAFHRDLAIAAVQWRNRSSTVNTLQFIKPVLDAGGPLSEVLRLGAEANLQTFPEDAAFLTTLALRASAYRQPELVAASHRRHVEAMAAYGEQYTAMIEAYQLRMKPPFTVEHLSAALAALAEGFGVQAASGEAHPEVTVPSDDPRTGSRWTLLGISVLALVEHMTEPDPPSGEGVAGEAQEPNGSPVIDFRPASATA